MWKARSATIYQTLITSLTVLFLFFGPSSRASAAQRSLDFAVVTGFRAYQMGSTSNDVTVITNNSAPGTYNGAATTLNRFTFRTDQAGGTTLATIVTSALLSGKKVHIVYDDVAFSQGGQPAFQVHHITVVN
jgi:hypothetical protein